MSDPTHDNGAYVKLREQIKSALYDSDNPAVEDPARAVDGVLALVAEAILDLPSEAEGDDDSISLRDVLTLLRGGSNDHAR
jgi:hypothetical protein